jgi:hypothetical protein
LLLKIPMGKRNKFSTSYPQFEHALFKKAHQPWQQATTNSVDSPVGSLLELPVFYGTRTFIAMLKIDGHSVYSEPDVSTPHPPILFL